MMLAIYQQLISMDMKQIASQVARYISVWQLASCLRSSTTQHQQVGSYRRCRRQVSTDPGNQQVQSVSLCSKCCTCPRRTKLASYSIGSQLAELYSSSYIISCMNLLLQTSQLSWFHCLSHSFTAFLTGCHGIGSSFLSDGHVRSAVLQKV